MDHNTASRDANATSRAANESMTDLLSLGEIYIYFQEHEVDTLSTIELDASENWIKFMTSTKYRRFPPVQSQTKVPETKICFHINNTQKCLRGSGGGGHEDNEAVQSRGRYFSNCYIFT